VVYYRSGYWPDHYYGNRVNPLTQKTEKESYWPLRTMLERSRAAKVPSAPAQLAGMKKIQQLLSTDYNALHIRFPRFFTLGTGSPVKSKLESLRPFF